MKRTSSKRLSIMIGFALLLILLAGNTLILMGLLKIQNDNENWVDHTRQVLFELERTESILKDAETGQRGFLYTGESEYLAPYNLAVAQIGSRIDNLAQLTGDNSSEQARIPVLRSLAQARLVQLAYSISLYQTGRQREANLFVKSGAGLVTMNDIRNLISAMEQEEESLAVSRTATYEKSIQIPIICIYLASFLAAAGLIIMAFIILRGIDQRERYLSEIWKHEEWYRVTLTSIGDAVIATNQHGKVTFLNPAAEAITGTSLSQGIGMDILKVFPIFNEFTQEPAESPVNRVMQSGYVMGTANHTVLKRADGVTIPIEDSAAPIRDDQDALMGVVLVFRDVTVDRRSREVLRKTEKLAAAARLSASVAHEINNPLEAVGNLIYIAKTAPNAPPSVVEPLEIAEQELERVAHITRQTLGFYRESSVPELVEITNLIESVLRLYSNKLETKNIAIERDFCECPPVLGMPGELKQVVSNLISNAADAVGRDGTITVRTFCVAQPEGDFINMVIEDDGPGIAAENLDRIFEPFFTTKKDVGTGLGLWVAKEIVERHGGSIEVKARGDGLVGASFSALLPCSAKILVGTAQGSSSREC